MRIRKIYMLMLIVLVGCMKVDVPSVPATPSATQPESADATPQNSSISDISCPQITEGLPDNINLSGKLVLHQNNIDGILDLAESIFTEIPQSAIYSISPDGRYIFGYTFGENIYVRNVTGETMNVFPWDKEWTEANTFLYSGIRDFETHLVSLKWWNTNTLAVATLPVGSISLLNIDTGDVNNVFFPYSDELYYLGPTLESRNEFALFSPTLDGVVYATDTAHFVVRKFDGDVNKIVWAGYVGNGLVNPVWSPNGEYLAVPIEDDLYIVDELGQDFPVTNFNQLFNDPYMVYLQQIEWSPDSQKIAMNVVVKSVQEKGQYRLLIYDWTNRQVVDYCTPDPDSTSFGSDAPGDFSILWSPDSRYIATETTIINISDRIIYKIPDVVINFWVGEWRIR